MLAGTFDALAEQEEADLEQFHNDCLFPQVRKWGNRFGNRSALSEAFPQVTTLRPVPKIREQVGNRWPRAESQPVPTPPPMRGWE